MKNNIMVRLLFLFLLISGMSISSESVFAEKKATEGKNDIDIEFYAPTPVKPDPVKPKPVEPTKPIDKFLPKTGEKQQSLIFNLIGFSIMMIVLYILFNRKVGDNIEK
ncbi:LPXTG cell wall anchor domain-containing protein [Vagococcus fluvialis]|uniref:LPXTG cell wall anchor domain-containing protein n=1 Tax=Vagococcus fluvialis TaxID=2738 RepID=UPI001A8CEA11|nr:LPXTG cell wall anchor domain-containing protein [Vagococcus fluvialis]MBO0429551.1 LPXTG cell wall anchor domain-containing protein [Vagococcus fluvialis]